MMWDFICDRKSRGFFRFWFAQLITQFGDRFCQMALVSLITIRHPGSILEMSKLLAFTIIPTFIVGPIAGVYIDRWDRRAVLFICYFIQGLLVLWAAFYLVHLPDIWLYAVVFLVFSLSRFYIPAKMSFIPEIVHQDDLHVANSLSTISGMIASGLGVLLGSLIVEHRGPFVGFIWDAVCYFLAGVFVFSIATLRHRLPDKKAIIAGTREILRVPKSVWHEIVDGIQYIRSQKEISFIFWMMAVLSVPAGAIYPVIIVFIQQVFHSVTKDLGFLSVPLVLGLFLGSLAYGSWGKKIAAYKVIFWTLILAGGMEVLFTCMVASTHNRLVALGLSFMSGFVLAPVTIAPYTVINKVCTREMSGKVFAAMEFVVYLAFLGAMMISSFLSGHIERVWILIGVGGIFVLVGLVGLYSEPLDSRRL